MNGGILRHNVEIYKPITTSDSYGDNKTTYLNTGSIRCGISPISGKETFTEAGYQNEITHKIQMRYTTDIAVDDVLVYNGREFTIQYILNWNEKNMDMTVLVFEKLSKDIV